MGIQPARGTRIHFVDGSSVEVSTPVSDLAAAINRHVTPADVYERQRERPRLMMMSRFPDGNRIYICPETVTWIGSV